LAQAQAPSIAARVAQPVAQAQAPSIAARVAQPVAQVLQWLANRPALVEAALPSADRIAAAVQENDRVLNEALQDSDEEDEGSPFLQGCTPTNPLKGASSKEICQDCSSEMDCFAIRATLNNSCAWQTSYRPIGPPRKIGNIVAFFGIFPAHAKSGPR